jgi:periplasmic protein TonB
MAAVVQAFPSLYGINARSFALAFIIVLHVGLYAAFTSMSPPREAARVPPDIEFIPIENKRVKNPEPMPLPGGQIEITAATPTSVPRPDLTIDSSDWKVAPVPAPIDASDAPIAAPVVVEPQIDTRRGLREPIYPASEIRLNHSGTVVLLVEVLPSGKIGNVRLSRSSGYPKLDEAAMRAAREWRLTPGTHDGVATTMWKEVPITFRLTN